MENVSSWSSAFPVPTATQDNGSSATWTGNPVSLENLLSIFFNKAPPPVNVNPISTKSADSSGGVFSKETGLPVHVADDPLSCVAVGTGKALDQEETFSTMLSEY